MSDVERLRVAMSGALEQIRAVVREELQALFKSDEKRDARVYIGTEYVGVQITTPEGHIYRGAAYLVELADTPLEDEGRL